MHTERRSFRPNSFPVATRLVAVLAATFALAYCVAELAVGYTYMPAKRGGVILSGGPTLMVAMAALLFCLLSLSVVIDHHDRRDNEPVYRRVRLWMAKTGGVLLLAAPVLEIALAFVRQSNGQAPFLYRGFAADVPMHVPAWRTFGALLEARLLHGFVSRLLLVGLCLGGLLMLAEKVRIGIAEGLKVGVAIAVTFLLSLTLLTTCAEQVLSGEARVNRQTLNATEHTARFNAVLVTRAFVGTSFLLVGCVATAGLVRRRGRIEADQAARAAG